MEDEIKITVTSQDLANSNYYDNDNCALATALKREFPNKGIRVGGHYADIGENRYRIDDKSSDALLLRCGKPRKHKFEVTLTLR